MLREGGATYSPPPAITRSANRGSPDRTTSRRLGRAPGGIPFRASSVQTPRNWRERETARAARRSIPEPRRNGCLAWHPCQLLSRGWRPPREAPFSGLPKAEETHNHYIKLVILQGRRMPRAGIGRYAPKRAGGATRPHRNWHGERAEQFFGRERKRGPVLPPPARTSRHADAQ